MRIGDRVTTVIDDGPYAGTQAIVDEIAGWPVFVVAKLKFDAVSNGSGPLLLDALDALYEFYVEEARPVWNVENVRGPVPPVVGEMLRVPVPVFAGLFALWLGTFQPDAAPEVDDAEQR